MAELCSIAQHNRRSAAHVIKFPAKPAFLEDGGAGFAIIEISGEMTHIEAGLAGKVQHDFPLPDITAFREEGPADSQIKFTANRLALPESAPRGFKSRQGGRRPLVAKRLEDGFGLLQGCQPYFQFKFSSIGRASPINFQGEGSFHQSDSTLIFRDDLAQAHGRDVTPRSIILSPFP